MARFRHPQQEPGETPQTVRQHFHCHAELLEYLRWRLSVGPTDDDYDELYYDGKYVCVVNFRPDVAKRMIEGMNANVRIVSQAEHGYTHNVVVLRVIHEH